MDKELSPSVSVIVPVYNAAGTLDASLSALKGQTYPFVNIIFVNDCSTDTSLAVLQDFTLSIGQRDGYSAKIVTHQQNKGVAVARNTGLEHARGDYICYLDADDWIEPNAIEMVVQKALETGADIVGFNWYLAFNKNKRKMNQPSFDSPLQAVQKILQGSMRWNLWLFLTRRSLYQQHNIRFIPGMNMGEDLLVMLKLFAFAQRVSYLDRPLYHYGQSNADSLTKTYSERHIMEVSRNISEAEKFLLKSRFASQLGDHFFFLKLNIKLPMLISGNTDNYRKWENWFPEANPYIAKNGAWPWRIRFLQHMALARQYWIVKLYYYVIVRFVYGVLYK